MATYCLDRGLKASDVENQSNGEAIVLFKRYREFSNFCFQYSRFGLDYADVHPNYKKSITSENS